MPGRTRNPDYWNTEAANDNEPCRAIAAEGVVQCLHFLASEAEHLGFPAAGADIFHAARVLQAEIDADRAAHAVSGIGNAPAAADRVIAAAWAPIA